ncbi:2-polyprenylphenol 6-hydroxylase [Candidatus Calescamantes bacterium]|nr:2-polyprenylphenol 6-hydroxylase [Candidatus Calescamantes bacterium]
MLGDIKQKIHNIQRLNQILWVLVKYGFGYIVDRLHIGEKLIGRKLVRRGPLKRLDIFDMPASVRLRKVLEELGPTFIKLGQILSTRPDLVPLEFSEEFKKLQDKAPVFEYEKAKKIVEEELKSPIDELFDEFSVKPIAAASLSQVHLGKLKKGEKVIVKVQRPNVERIIKQDIEILYTLAKLAEKYIEESKLYNPVEIVDEFRKAILKEIDFNTEASNIDRFRRNFKGDDTVYIPKVFHNLSTKRVLTIEKIEGIKVTDVEKIEKSGLDRKKIAINGANAVLKQIFVDGFFHADPHPGNIFVLDNNRIAFLDFGMVGRIDEETKSQFANILQAVIERDAPTIIESFIDMGMVEEDMDIKKLELDVADLVDRYYEVPLKELRMEGLLGEIINVVSQNRIKVPPNLYLLAKALITVESIGRELDPDFDMVTKMSPFVKKLFWHKYNPKLITKDIQKTILALADFTKTFPKEITKVLNKIKKGVLKIEFEHKDLEHLILRIHKASNRISFSVIIAALIIGSSIIMQTDKGPLFLDFPVFGIFGFLIAGIMGLWLAISILRSGKL